METGIIKKKCSENTENMEGFTILYKSRINMIDMMKKLGYNTSDYENFTTSELNHMVSYNQLDMIFKNDKINKQIYIKYFEFGQNKVLNKNLIMEIYEDLFEIEKILTKNDALFIVYNCDANDSCKIQLKHIWEEKGYLISVININRLQFNLLEHSLVPKHIVLQNNEKKEFVDKYGTNIPEISRFDPVAQIIAMKPNDICKIERPSKNAIKADYYRICINK
tara:strand:+ start:4709 stop:5374 length:666 start_codon:yes stop_codon:yes gene_type:complete